jgi:hypothetical protein
VTDRLDKIKADKLNKAMPKLLKLLVLVMAPGVNKNERAMAYRALNQNLQSIGTDVRDLAQLIKELQEAETTKPASSSLTKAEVTRILDQGIEIGRQQGRAEEAAKHRSTAVVLPAGIDAGVDGYTWREIVAHCAAYSDRLTQWEEDFITDMANQLTNYRRAPTQRRAGKIRDIFRIRFDNTIE